MVGVWVKVGQEYGGRHGWGAGRGDGEGGVRGVATGGEVRTAGYGEVRKQVLGKIVRRGGDREEGTGKATGRRLRVGTRGDTEDRVQESTGWVRR